MLILYFLEQDDMYGYKISKMISERTNNMYNIKETSLYSSLRRLELSSCLQSYTLIDNTTNRKKRMYKITGKGKKLYFCKCKEWRKTIDILNLFVLGGDYDEN